MPMFGKSQKSSQQLVKKLQEVVSLLECADKKAVKAAEKEVTKHLILVKNKLYGTSDIEPPTNIVVSQLIHELYNTNLLLLLIRNLNRIGFESKKDVTKIFNNVLPRQIGIRLPTVEYICANPEILVTLMIGYEQHEIALNCGFMLRECARYEALAKIMLNSDEFFNFFRYVEVSTFDIASDAFSTFRELLTRHKILCAVFLEQNYEKIFIHYQDLLSSKNYFTRRQSLKLLGEILFDRHNSTVLTNYISNPEHLKQIMNILKDKSANIQYEAFHVFKLFIANPDKPNPILHILPRNQEKLVHFLTRFLADRPDAEQFNDEKAYLIDQIKQLSWAPQQ